MKPIHMSSSFFDEVSDWKNGLTMAIDVELQYCLRSSALKRAETLVLSYRRTMMVPR